jgi:diadenosine tetraphosphate (Ap4A) HIT family hydrolase
MPCAICSRIELWKSGSNPNFIAEFKHSIFVLGDHQFFPGYGLILLKEHTRELHDLPEHVQAEYFLETTRAAKAIEAAFKPLKMNYSCYGNLDPHVHWHLFPRYSDDPQRTMPPWVHMDRFGEVPGSAEQRQNAIELIRNCLV